MHVTEAFNRARFVYLRTIIGRRYSKLLDVEFIVATGYRHVLQVHVCVPFVTGTLNNHTRVKSLEESSLRISSKINVKATLNVFSNVHGKRY